MLPRILKVMGIAPMTPPLTYFSSFPLLLFCPADQGDSKRTILAIRSFCPSFECPI